MSLRRRSRACSGAGGSFYAGTQLVTTRPTPPIHPLTGRQIAGIATDASWLDRATREQEEAPEQALQLIGIRPGMVVADVGAGSGYMTTRLARLVGPTGKVYANDLQPGMLQIIQDKARAEHLSNIEIVQGTETDARLPDNAIDLRCSSMSITKSGIRRRCFEASGGR